MWSDFPQLMTIRRIAVCEAQVPFVRGGAEYHVRTLVGALRRRGYQAERVSIPFTWYPKDEILTHAAAWRLINLTEANGQPIDLVIGLKFPTYFVRHPNKVAWVIHQHRAAYDLCGTRFSDFGHLELDVALRDRLLHLDRDFLGECRRVYANARNTANRLATFNGVRADPLYHPPPFADRLEAGPYGDYILVVGRVESIKRPDLVIHAMTHIAPRTRLRIVGEGTARESMMALAESLGLSDRIEFLGATDEADLLALYKGALAVVYVPYDEDFGYVTLEAFLAQKPVITVTDAGGPLEFVEDDVNGYVCEANPEAIATAVNRLAENRARAAELGRAGYERARLITWDTVVDTLVQ
jgi:glycosyltransferase involved in cell wall biosynthesis